MTIDVKHRRSPPRLEPITTKDPKSTKAGRAEKRTVNLLDRRFLNPRVSNIGSIQLIIPATPLHRSFPRIRRSVSRLISPGNRFTLSFSRFRGSVRSQQNSRRPSALSRTRKPFARVRTRHCSPRTRSRACEPPSRGRERKLRGTHRDLRGRERVRADANESLQMASRNSRSPSVFSRMRTGTRNRSSAASQDAPTGQEDPPEDQDLSNSHLHSAKFWPH